MAEQLLVNTCFSGVENLFRKHISLVILCYFMCFVPGGKLIWFVFEVFCRNLSRLFQCIHEFSLFNNRIPALYVVVVSLIWIAFFLQTIMLIFISFQMSNSTVSDVGPCFSIMYKKHRHVMFCVCFCWSHAQYFLKQGRRAVKAGNYASCQEAKEEIKVTS